MVPKHDYSRALNIAQVLLVLSALIFLVFVVLDFSVGRTSEGLKDVEAIVTALAVAGLIRFVINPARRRGDRGAPRPSGTTGVAGRGAAAPGRGGLRSFGVRRG